MNSGSRTSARVIVHGALYERPASRTEIADRMFAVFDPSLRKMTRVVRSTNTGASRYQVSASAKLLACVRAVPRATPGIQTIARRYRFLLRPGGLCPRLSRIG
jgi:hypothetical protein